MVDTTAPPAVAGPATRPATRPSTGPATNKDRFVQYISNSILTGRWNPGDKLPTERELAAEMQIGKTVVHSGFEYLASIGLVDVKPKSGVYVADYTKTGSIETLNAIVHLNGDELSREVTVAVLELRLAIEGLALRCLCRCRTPEDVAHLRAGVAQLRERAPRLSPAQLAEGFFLWHREVCIRSGKSILPLFMNTTHDVSIAFWVNYLHLYGAPFALDRLDRFADWIEAGDGDAAYNLLADGIDDYLARLDEDTVVFSR